MKIPKQQKLELWVLEALWAGGELSMREIRERIPENVRPSYETVRSVIYRLQTKKVVVRVKKVSRSQIFVANVSKTAICDRLVADFTHLFAGNVQEIFERLISAGKVTQEDLQHAQRLCAAR